MLQAFIAEYIAGRRQTKLDAFDKEAAKRLAAGEQSTVIQQERRELEQRYEPATWLSDAASRAGQISLVTHAAKFTHGDSKSSSIYSEQHPPEGYLTSATLDRLASDAVGNAAALDVAKLLQTEVAGDSLLACLQRQEYLPLAAFAQDDKQLQAWVTGFSAALDAGKPASHKLAKQVYFPVDGGYHLLSPLFATSLTQALYQRMAALRFGDDAKAAWQARRNNLWHPQPLVTFPGVAEMHFGGTKPQNISSLNSARGGRVWLLSARPPEWQQIASPPKTLVSLFASGGAFDRQANTALKRIVTLMIDSGSRKNQRIRQARDRDIDELIDLLFQTAAGLQREEWQGWTLNCPDLKGHQQLWLDPWRSKSDALFAAERQQDGWQSLVAEDFARWFNYRLRKSLPDVGQVEKREWETRPLLRTRLREMEQIIAEGLK